MLRKLCHLIGLLIMLMTSLASSDYLPVSTASLLPATVVDCDLYIRRRGCSFPELYRGRTYPLENKDLDSLREDGVDHLYIRMEDADGYRDYLCEHVLRQRGMPVGMRIKALTEIARVAFENALSAQECQQLVGVSQDFGRAIAEMVSADSLLFKMLFATLEHDYGTFTHVCNVGIYSAVIAQQMGLCSSTELSELTAGALLHDIGYRQLPPYVFRKPGKLTPVELELIRQHPVLGFRELGSCNDVTRGQLMMVYQHHERLDGSGYPTGIVGNEIHPWAKICAVADIFNAMSCKRPHRQAIRLSEICDHLDRFAGIRYDAEIVAWLLDHLRRSTGEQG